MKTSLKETIAEVSATIDKVLASDPTPLEEQLAAADKLSKSLLKRLMKVSRKHITRKRELLTQIIALKEENARLRKDAFAEERDRLKAAFKAELKLHYLVMHEPEAFFLQQVSEMELGCQFHLFEILDQFREHKALYDAARNGEKPSQEYYERLLRFTQDLHAMSYDWYEESKRYWTETEEERTHRLTSDDHDADGHWDDDLVSVSNFYASEEGQAYLREQESYRKTPEYAREQAAQAAAWEVESKKYAEAHGLKYEALQTAKAELASKPSLNNEEEREWRTDWLPNSKQNDSGTLWMKSEDGQDYQREREEYRKTPAYALEKAATDATLAAANAQYEDNHRFLLGQ
ncbi:hypothetical protein MUN81_10255 [Hymenobacter sp. 5317J-9]|uniref:hypothetical protein n=1 Tax=Hymenobacter sp. 5317J-9 TaxID=2932250 RepID=UPI001FD6C9FA|nr:hypothetical protein [Hymenobacter sp. 5317J-9]UOQ99860.1 hypothetical protein MUN81_10255 [Hymenobacter sp. 5317J-9]